MSFKLPTPMHPIYEYFDVEDLLDWEDFPSLPQVLRSARNSMENMHPAPTSITYFVKNQDDTVLLVEVYAIGWKRLWTFGKA